MLTLQSIAKSLSVLLPGFKVRISSYRGDIFSRFYQPLLGAWPPSKRLIYFCISNLGLIN